jgi:signal peptidase II
MAWYLSLIGLILGLDLISKYLVQQYLADEVVITSFFSLDYITNPHLAFSIPLPSILQIVFSFILLLGLAYYLYTLWPLKWGYYYGSAFIFGGALGNLYERVIFGEVTDFLDFSFWPSFNVADSFIVIGVILLVISDLPLKKSQKTGKIKGNKLKKQNESS